MLVYAIVAVGASSFGDCLQYHHPVFVSIVYEQEGVLECWWAVVEMKEAFEFCRLVDIR